MAKRGRKITTINKKFVSRKMMEDYLAGLVDYDTATGVQSADDCTVWEYIYPTHMPYTVGYSVYPKHLVGEMKGKIRFFRMVDKKTGEIFERHYLKKSEIELWRSQKIVILGGQLGELQ